MSELFNPTLVISIGPSAKKALDNLENMLVDAPEYLKNVVELYNIEELESFQSNIQKIIDESLLSAEKLNSLVDLGYKIRTENESNIKINVFVFWDVYGIDFNIQNLIEILFNANYCMIDKTRHSGLSLTILSILDREWLYDNSISKNGIKKLEETLEFLTIQDNMINVDSKIFLLHSIANDGIRISVKDIEYACAVLTYLSILPSTNPPLATYNTRLLKYEGKYKIGTVGISTLTVFKDLVKEQFSNLLLKDIISHATSYESFEDFSLYSSNYIVNSNYIINTLRKDIPINSSDDSKLIINSKYKLNLEANSIWNRKVEEYMDVIQSWTHSIEYDYVNKINKDIEEKQIQMYIQSRDKLHEDLDTVITFNSLKDGLKFLKDIQKKINQVSVEFGAKEVPKVTREYNIAKNKISNFPNFIGYCLRILIFQLFLFDSINAVMNKLNLSILTQALMSLFTFSIVILLATINYKNNNKYLKRSVENYKEAFLKQQGCKINKYISNSINNYFKMILEYIEDRIKIIEECINNFNKVEISNENNNTIANKLEYMNLVTDLLDAKDRVKFYNHNKKDVRPIYMRLIKEINGYENIRKKENNENIINYIIKVSNEYTRIDFYDYVKLNWEDEKDSKISQWLNSGLIKSKQLLQFNQDDNLEEHKIFIGSKLFINNTSDVIKKNLSNYQSISIDGQDIYTNCISIIKIYLGIEMNKVTPFINASRRSSL